MSSHINQSNQTNQTICGIATGSNNAGVGIVRVSGEKSLEIAEKILKKSKKDIKPRFAYYGDFYNNDEVIDQGIAIYFPNPNSFTGEDIVEFQGHGGSIVLENILGAVLDCGAKIAEAGEFSKRAFLNGKMDLVQAEAIADMIDSTSKRANKLALNSMRGEFSNKINNLRTQIIELRVFVEATIDFVDEEIDFIADNKVAYKIATIEKTLEDILKTSKNGAIIKNGINIAIIGKPNAGKSSLLNALTTQNSAIVTDIAGTTRDAIKEQISINGIKVNLIDTAGIRTSSNEVENIGIDIAKDESKRADIVLLVFESGEEPDKNLLPENSNYILVQNKIDLSTQKVNEAMQISAKNNIGIDGLKTAILKKSGLENLDENTSLARSRHIQELKSSLKFVKNAKDNLSGLSIELVADDLNQASVHLGKITGEFSSDDLLGEIFSNFCIGK
jgi:tRNA modification GTPase